MQGLTIYWDMNAAVCARQSDLTSCVVTQASPLSRIYSLEDTCTLTLIREI